MKTKAKMFNIKTLNNLHNFTKTKSTILSTCKKFEELVWQTKF